MPNKHLYTIEWEPFFMARKNRMLSIRVTQKQYDALEALAKRIRQRTGFRITRASIMLKLMEYGLSDLEKEFPPDEEENEDTLHAS